MTLYLIPSEIVMDFKLDTKNGTNLHYVDALEK